MTMTKAITDNGSDLTKRIQAWFKKGTEMHQELHALCCSAVLLAAKHGRADHLNVLVNGLPALMADGLRGWVNANALDPDGNVLWFGQSDTEHPQWLKYSKKEGFTIIKGAPRPAEYVIETVAQRFDTSFLFKTAKKTVEDTKTFETEMIRKIAAFSKQMETQAKDNPRAVQYQQQAAELLAKAMREFNVQPGNAPLMIEHKAA